MSRRLPPFGRRLSERVERGDLPFLVVVTCADGHWDNAASWSRSPDDVVGIPFPGDSPPCSYRWPVAGCFCIVAHGRGQDDDVINALTSELLRAGAASVAVFDERFATTRAIYPARHFSDVTG